LWNLDIIDAGFAQLLQTVRLKRVDVEVSMEGGSVVESISPTLQPPGFTP
jgi:hypothetical protein